jgi:hypothetical protein
MVAGVALLAPNKVPAALGVVPVVPNRERVGLVAAGVVAPPPNGVPAVVPA